MKPAGRCGCLAYAMPSMHQASLSSHFPDRRWQSLTSTGLETLQQQFISPGKLVHEDGTMFRSALTCSLLSRGNPVRKRVGHARNQANITRRSSIQQQQAVSGNLTMLGSCCSIEMTGSVRQRKPFELLASKATHNPRLKTSTHASVYWVAPLLPKTPG